MLAFKSITRWTGHGGTTRVFVVAMPRHDPEIEKLAGAEVMIDSRKHKILSLLRTPEGPRPDETHERIGLVTANS